MSGNEQKIRVAILEPVGGHSGMDYYDFGLCQGLVNAGILPVLYTCDETGVPTGEPELDIRRFYKGIFGDDPAWIRGLRFLAGSLRSLSHAKRVGAKICHLHFFYVGPLEFFNVVAARLIGFRVIITVHDVESFVSDLTVPRLMRMAYRLADQIIVHNHTSKIELVDFVGIDSHCIVIVPSGNYLHTIGMVPDSVLARKKLGVPAGAKVLLFFGQIKQVKGLDVLLKAMPAVVRQFPQVVLVIAGRPWKVAFEPYQQLINQHQLENNSVLHIRFIPNDEVATFFAAADLVVLPYRRIYQSAVLLMSMSYGKPVLVSDLAAMAEVVTDGVTGFVFPTGDADALGDKLCQILSDLDSAGKVGTRAKTVMRQEYSWDVIGERTATCYRKILQVGK